MMNTTNTTTQDEPLLVLPIQSKHTSSTIPEWAMLELNGDLLLPQEVLPDSAMLELGSLQILDDSTTTITLICGTHEWQGQVEVLKQPFVVLQRSDTEYTMQGVITHKLLFNRYPKTILS